MHWCWIGKYAVLTEKACAGSFAREQLLPHIRPHCGGKRTRRSALHMLKRWTLCGMPGAELVPFSPVQDAVLPENIGGLYLPGGYPELYAKT